MVACLDQRQGQLDGGVAEPDDGGLVVAPAQLAFHEASLGAMALRSLTVTNTSTLYAHDIDSFVFSGYPRFFVQDLQLPTTLEPGEELHFQVGIVPDAYGRREGELLLLTDGDPLSVPLVYGDDLACIAVAPTIQFPELWRGQVEAMLLDVISCGDVPLEIDAHLEGDAGFRLAGAPSLTVPPGRASQLEVSFSPQHEGEHVGSLVLASNTSRGDVVVSLRGGGAFAPECPRASIACNPPGEVELGSTLFCGAIPGAGCGTLVSDYQWQMDGIGELPHRADVTIPVDFIGTRRLSLVVKDQHSVSSSTTFYEITTSPSPGLGVTLASDHASAGLELRAREAEGEWSEQVDGLVATPTTLRLVDPGAGRHLRLGVYARGPHGTATVKVYRHGQEVLSVSGPVAEDELWEAVDVVWDQSFEPLVVR